MPFCEHQSGTGSPDSRHCSTRAGASLSRTFFRELCIGNLRPFLHTSEQTGDPLKGGGLRMPRRLWGGEPLPQAFVALREGVPVGTVSLEMGEHPLHAETFCCIVGLYVPPTFRRQGMGA